MFAIVFLLVLGITSATPRAGLGADRVRLALPAKSMGYLPLFVGVHRGFFKDEGIDIEISMLLPQLAHNALLSGDVDYHGVADSALRLAAKGAPMKSIFFGAARPNYFLMAKPQYKSIAELRGKYLGMVRFGDTVELATRIAFNREGLDPQRDAIPIMIGFRRPASPRSSPVRSMPPSPFLRITSCSNRRVFASCFFWAMPSNFPAMATRPPSAN